MSGQLGIKVDLKEVQAAINNCQSDIGLRMSEIRDELREKMKEHTSELQQQITEKVGHAELAAALNKKMDASQVASVKSDILESDEIA